MTKQWPLLVAALLCLGADYGQLPLRVVGVHDGDTITALDDSKSQYKIRLDAIDAPELGQPFGQASTKALSEKVFGKDIVVIPKSKDKYGRTVGHILIDGRDVNLEMLEGGMAWHYKHYDHNARLAPAEEEARTARKGYGLIVNRCRCGSGGRARRHGRMTSPVKEGSKCEAWRGW
jgi:hypothetical protein